METKTGKVVLKVPRLRKLPFETRIIERYERRESRVEDTHLEKYLLGESVCRVKGNHRGSLITRVTSSTQ
ncbi:transposase [Rubripirellula amarantea]|uniref:transposase n=1 Tax=Rubripirellula amarantea TaxID=2527999 RepID=UPI0013EF25DE|nr:transposase [Rubripirellula amarantea]